MQSRNGFKNNLVFFAILLVCISQPAFAATIYVDADAPGANDGSSWEDAFNHLQDALAVAQCGDEIWVAQGVYTPDSNSADPNGSGDREATFQLISGVAIYGGFAGGENSLDERDPNDPNNETILSGDLMGNDGPNFANNGENSYHVVTGSGTDETAVLDGFTITAGNADGSYPHYYGGGMYNDSSSPTVTNCTFSGNSAKYLGGGGDNNDSSSADDGRGGGMYNNDSSPTVTNCTFTGNSARYGGGMFNWGSNSRPTVSNCTFSDNSGGYSCGGMFNDESSPTVTNCIFTGNSADTIGGGMCNTNSSNPTVTNCTFIGNSAGERAGGMDNYESDPNITNCTFSDNWAGGYGGGMFNYDSSLAVTNCTFSGNAVGMSDDSWRYYGGGGMANSSGNPNITNCIFTGNSAGENGGGMKNAFSDSNITNCTFSSNSAGEHGGGMFNQYDSSPTVTNCILWDNDAPDGNEIYNNPDISRPVTLIISYCDIAGSGGSTTWDPNLGSDGGGNIDADPLFVDANGPDGIAGTADDNLRLLWGSPCIDAGDNNSVPADTIDLDNDGNTVELIPWDLEGNKRLVDHPNVHDTGNGTPPIVDMGAYEFFLRIEVAMRFTPQAMNPRSKGKWLKAHIVLPEGFSVEDVDTNEPVVAQIAELEIDADHVEVFVNEDGFVEIEAAFERTAFCGIGDGDDIVEVTVEGQFTDGHHFYGTDSIKVITRDFTSYLGALASHWLQIGCSPPDWCDGLDIDQDSAVNFVDFSRFDRCCIEVVQE